METAVPLIPDFLKKEFPRFSSKTSAKELLSDKESYLEFLQKLREEFFDEAEAYTEGSYEYDELNGQGEEVEKILKFLKQ